MVVLDALISVLVVVLVHRHVILRVHLVVDVPDSAQDAVSNVLDVQVHVQMAAQMHVKADAECSVNLVALMHVKADAHHRMILQAHHVITHVHRVVQVVLVVLMD